MEYVLTSTAYLFASVLFILSLRGLSSQETARRGNLYGMIGMSIALVAALTGQSVTGYGFAALALLIGAAIGTVLAIRVAMTAMPELVALLHSFVGAAAVLVGYASYLNHHGEVGAARMLHLSEVYLAVLIGAITFTGSIIAFAKLKGMMSGKPWLLPGRHWINLVMALACVALGAAFLQQLETQGLLFLGIATVIAGILGIHLVAAIGGADMPVVVSMLNSYSGWTASAAGFMLSNDLLIVTGALVGSSGAILSYIMCRAMNRSIWNVIFGGFGADQGSTAPKATSTVHQDVNEIQVDETADLLLSAKQIVVVPGYGLAVARAQHAVREMAEILRKKNNQVRFAIHPVAGRLPGHMNVLLAEANVPYDIVFEMEEINEDFPTVDVVMVIGANDIVNPGAQTDKDSPIYGMPVLEVWKAAHVIMMKRGRAAGYAGIDNPLYYHDNTHMLFGDAGETMNALVARLRSISS